MEPDPMDSAPQLQVWNFSYGFGSAAMAPQLRIRICRYGSSIRYARGCNRTAAGHQLTSNFSATEQLGRNFAALRHQIWQQIGGTECDAEFETEIVTKFNAEFGADFGAEFGAKFAA